MRVSLYLMVLLLFGGSGALEIPLNGQGPGLGKAAKSGARTLRIAVIQMKSLDHDVDGI